ncbi:unnamed protein product [Paramecium sonneborni]|uniref:Uncharacterized protein n=1 Tax=Paramecium sonneborni TaxID=65129 RepID=A0A8S1PI96_9CILI|nr:unnamed protein product [Paramecium sonneborni]
MGKYYLLGYYNNNLCINCILDLCMNYMMDSIVIQRHKYFLRKPILNFYQRTQIEFNQKLYLLNQLQNSKFQLQIQSYHKTQFTLNKYQGKCIYMYILPCTLKKYIHGHPIPIYE